MTFWNQDCCEFLGKQSSDAEFRRADLFLRPIVRVGICHIRDGIEVQRAMCPEEILAMFFGEGIDLVLFTRVRLVVFRDKRGRGAGALRFRD